MARFSTVDFYPPEGFPDRLWDSASGHTTPVRDAMLRSARPVAALYSAALAEIDVSGPRSGLSVTFTAGRESSGVAVTVWGREPDDGPERAFATLCAEVDRLDARGRAELVLAILHAAVQQLAVARDWDPQLFERCRQYVVEHEYVFASDGPWKASPDRRHEARATYRLEEPDGFGRARLEVRRRGEQDPCATSASAVASCRASRFASSASTLRWTGSGEVAFRPLVGHGVVTEAVTGRLEGTVWSFDPRNDVSVRMPAAGVAEDPRAAVPPVSASID